MTSLCFAEIADWCCSVSYWTLQTKPIKFRRRCIYICPNGPWVQFDWKRGTTFQRVILRTLIFVIVPSLRSRHYGIIYFASAAVAVDPSNMTASSSASWSRFRPPSNFVNGHVSTMCVHGLSLATITGRWLGKTPFVQASTTCFLSGNG